MAKIVELQTNKDSNGKLTVFENLLPSEIKRVFYIYDQLSEKRGGHRHKKAYHALICISGSCTVNVDNGITQQKFSLENPAECLMLEPEDWREMTKFEKHTILLCISTENFDIEDYIYEKHSSICH